MNIQITPKKTDGVERLLQIEVPATDVKAAQDKAARKYASQVRLPGFRVGKAPPAMVLKRFANEIRQEAVDSIVQEAYKEVVEREQFKLAAQPHIHDLKFVDGEPLTFDLHVEVRPDLSLPRLSGFRVTRAERTVSETDVREQVEQVREQRASWSPVEDRPNEGDMVTALLSTSDESGEMPEGKEYRIVLGSGQAIPGIEEVMMEAKPGETIERPVKWPDDFPDESQRATTKTVRVTVNEVKRKSLPELDDAFAREVGDFDSLDTLMKAVRDDMVKAATREADADVRQKLLDEIIGANPFEVPPSWVNQTVQAYGQMYQIPEEQAAQFQNEFRPAAEAMVRRDLVLDTIAERETLSATEADIDDRVAEMAKSRNADVGQLYAQLQKAGRIKEIERALTEEKVFKWLKERNTIE